MKVTDESILDEASKQREHEAELARIDAEADTKIAQQKRYAAESRHTLLGAVTAIVAALAVILTVILVWAFNVDEDRQRRERQAERDDAVAELCIREGNIWIDGSCLIARRGQ